MENIGDLAYLADNETLPTENVGQQLQAYHIRRQIFEACKLRGCHKSNMLAILFLRITNTSRIHVHSAFLLTVFSMFDNSNQQYVPTISQSILGCIARPCKAN